MLTLLDEGGVTNGHPSHNPVAAMGLRAFLALLFSLNSAGDRS